MMILIFIVTMQKFANGLSDYLFSGELLSGSAGTGFIPHVIHIASGEVCIFFLLTWIYLCFGFICC